MEYEKKKKKSEGLYTRIAKSGALGTKAKMAAENETKGTIFERKKKR